MLRIYLLAFLTLIYQIVAFGQDPGQTLSEVTLTAHGNGQPIRKTGRNIWVIPGNLLSSSPAHSIDDLLRFIPGIEVQQRGPQGTQGDILIRGGTFQQVLVLIDGIRVNDPLTGHFNAYIPIDPLEIDRIEILKGPAAAIWGSEAVGGVIQIFTKTFSNKSTEKGKKVQAGVGIGEYELWQAQLRIQHQGERDRFSVSGTTRNSDGAPQRGTRGFFNLHTVQASWQRNLAKGWTLRIRSAWDGRDFGAQNFYTGFLSDTANEQLNSWWNHGQLVKTTTHGSWHADIGYKHTLDVYQFRPNAAANRNEMGLGQIQLRYQRNSSHPLQYQIGAQAIQRSIRSNDRGIHRVEQLALFGVGQYSFNPRWTSNVGMRIAHDELYGTILIPQLSLSYSKENKQWRLSAGRSFRDADFTERYNNYNKIFVSSGRIGNPTLAPEDAWQAEIGYDVSIQRKLFWHTSLFYRDHRGLIDWVTTPYANMPRQTNLSPTGTYALARNIDRVRTLGWESDLQYRDSIGKGVVLLQAGLLWLNNNAPAGGAGIYLNSHARFLVNFLTQYRIQRWELSVGGLYKERPRQTSASLSAVLTPAYFLMHARMTYTHKKNRWSPYIQCDNVLNTQFSDLLGAPMPGRWLSGGFRVLL